jgi:hypothetical protein
MPFFQPMLVADVQDATQPTGASLRLEHEPDASACRLIAGAQGHWYLPEDYAFCERARQCGYKIMADTTIRLWHHGSYGYGWEDAGKDKERYETFYFNVE